MSYLPIYIIHSLQSCAAKLFISFGKYSLLGLEKNLNDMKWICMGFWNWVYISAGRCRFRFRCHCCCRCCCRCRCCTPLKGLFPRCEANQAGGEDQLVGVGRCQRDRLDQGAGREWWSWSCWSWDQFSSCEKLWWWLWWPWYQFNNCDDDEVEWIVVGGTESIREQLDHHNTDYENP